MIVISAIKHRTCTSLELTTICTVTRAFVDQQNLYLLPPRLAAIEDNTWNQAHAYSQIVCSCKTIGNADSTKLSWEQPWLLGVCTVWRSRKLIENHTRSILWQEVQGHPPHHWGRKWQNWGTAETSKIDTSHLSPPHYLYTFSPRSSFTHLLSMSREGISGMYQQSREYSTHILQLTKSFGLRWLLEAASRSHPKGLESVKGALYSACSLLCL